MKPLKQNEVTPEMTQFAKDILHNTGEYPVGATVTRNIGGIDLIARVEKHTQVGATGEAKPDGIRGVSLYHPDVATKPIDSSKPIDPATPADPNAAWDTFLQQTLPVVGSVYSGDTASSAKKLEVSMGSIIGKPMGGVIWNDAKKQFNTTPDDIRNALVLIEKSKASQPKTAQYTLDQRFIRMSQILVDREKEKIRK